MNYEEYDKLPGVNFSRLKHMAISPLRYRWNCDHPREDTPFYRVGRAMHAFILEPERFPQMFTVYRDGVRRGKAWDAFKAEHADSTILSEDEYDRATGAGAAVLSHPIASELIAEGHREHFIQWTDGETGLACRGRLDVANGRILDIKSAADLHPRRFPAKAINLQYLTQLAWYEDGYRANGHDIHGDPMLIVVESAPPHDVVCWRVPAHVLELGRVEYRRLLSRLKECLATNTWPGQADDVVEFVAPEWAYGTGDPLDLVMPDGEQVSL